MFVVFGCCDGPMVWLLVIFARVQVYIYTHHLWIIRFHIMESESQLHSGDEFHKIYTFTYRMFDWLARLTHSTFNCRFSYQLPMPAKIACTDTHTHYIFKTRCCYVLLWMHLDVFYILHMNVQCPLFKSQRTH